jgi:hypothetical protein
MGIGIGGIAAPLPRKMYAWIGDVSDAGAGTLTQDLAVSGFSVGSAARIHALGYLGPGGPSDVGKLYVVCGGSTYELNSITNSGYQNWDFVISNGLQYNLKSDAAYEKKTHAFAMNDITAIRVSITPFSGSQTKEIFFISIEQLDVP